MEEAAVTGRSAGFWYDPGTVLELPDPVEAFNLLFDHERVHSVGVAFLSQELSKAMGMPAKDCLSAYLGGLYHDLGKCMIAPYYRDMTRKLQDHEKEELRKHPLYSKKILEESSLGNDENLVESVLEHHENMDGTGYPVGVSVNGMMKIRTGILRIGDVFDSLTDPNREYRGRAQNPMEAGETMGEYAGKKYTAKVLGIFLDKVVTKRNMERLYRIRNMFTGTP